MYNRYNRTKGIGVFQNPKAEIFGDLFKNIADLPGQALNARTSRLNAKTAAEAAAQDQRVTGVESFSQLQQMLSELTKNLSENTQGTQATTDIMDQLQKLMSQQATTQDQTVTRGDAGVNQGVSQLLQNVITQMGGGTSPGEAAMQQVLRSGAGAIAGVGNRSGTFGDTTTALLQNDLMAKAAEANVNANTAMLQQLGQLLQGGTETTIGKQNTTTDQSTSTEGKNTSNTTSTQNRTASETAKESTNTSTAGTSITDTFQDYLKDGSAGYGTNKNVLASLGQGITPQPVAPPVVSGQPPAGAPTANPAVPPAVNPLDGMLDTSDPSNPMLQLLRQSLKQRLV